MTFIHHNFLGDLELEKKESDGVIDFMKIIRSMPSFGIVEFGVDDVIRSGLIKEYIITKMELGL